MNMDNAPAYQPDAHDCVECLSCGDLYPARRAQLGYSVCLSCGEQNAIEQRAGWCIVPTPKGHYTRVTNKEELKHLNQKSR